MAYVIGIDGGGTKTTAALVHTNGVVEAIVTSGPTNMNVSRKEQITEELSQLLHQLQQESKQHFDRTENIFAGMSGAGTKRIQQELLTVFKQLVPAKTDICVVPDSVNALYSGTYGGPGIVQIAGTGSITYGRNGNGEDVRIGGWGYLFSDKGSGYDIGRRAIMAVLHAEEGLSDDTKLKELLFTYCQVSSARDLIEKIYRSEMPQKEIATLAPLFFQAYKAGDKVTKQQFKKVIEHLTLHIVTVYHQLFEQYEKVPVVLAGGIFHSQKELSSFLKKRVEEKINVTITFPAMPPIGGSVLGAIIDKQVPIDNMIIQNIIRSLNKAKRSAKYDNTY